MKKLHMIMLLAFGLALSVTLAHSFDSGKDVVKTEHQYPGSAILSFDLVAMPYVSMETLEVIPLLRPGKVEPTNKGYTMQVFHPPLDRQNI